jgi:hypothetical protein
MARILNRDKKSGQSDGSQLTAVAYDSSGVATVAAAQVDKLMLADKMVFEIGEPGLYAYSETADGATAETLTVPSGKVWRLVGLIHQQTNSGDAATRTVTVTSRTAADATIEALSSATSVASAETEYSFLFGSDGVVVGNSGVAAQGTLTLDTKPTADDTMTLNAKVFTWVAALTGAANELLIGADLAASKAALEAAFVDRDNGGVLHSVSDAVYTALGMTAVAFATNDMVFTASNQGTAGNALATTETYTAGTNVFDAATLGTTTAGVDEAGTISGLDFPTSGPLLSAGEDVYVIVTNGQTADDFKGYLFVIEYDVSPVSGS